ncbi:MAG: hypothetical protein ACKO3N_08885 [Verrucomicrobiota bacterium]
MNKLAAALLAVGLLSPVLTGTVSAGPIGSPRGLALEHDLRKVRGSSDDRLERGLVGGTPRGRENAIRVVPGTTADRVDRALVAVSPRLMETHPAVAVGARRAEPVGSGLATSR